MTAINYAERKAAIASQAYARYRTTRRFDSLDGWRAIAIIAVMFHHALSETFANPIASEGHFGVTLFFVISGFLIVTLLLRGKESSTGFSLRKFWMRRALRILPIYFTTLLVYVVLVGALEHSTAGADFFHNLRYFTTFTTNWFLNDSDRVIFFFSWSLAAEEQFYLVWPLIEVLVPSTRIKMAFLGVVIIASQTAFYRYGGTLQADLPSQILKELPLAIMLGTMLAHLLHHDATYRLLYAILGRRGSALGCLVVTLTILAVAPFLGFGGEMLINIAFMLLIGSTVIREDNDLAMLLQWTPIAWIGVVSYGMYMLHMLGINIVRQGWSMLHLPMSPVLFFLCSVGLTCAIATLSFKYYENRFLTLKRFFEDNPGSQRQLSPSPMWPPVPDRGADTRDYHIAD